MKAVVFIALIGLVVCGCSMVSNGSVTDSTEIPLEGADEVRLPEHAFVEHGSGATVLVHMKKTLGFAGHPPEPIRISDQRERMGVAARHDGRVLEIATFGEWDSRIEGGAWIELRFVVPSGVRVSRAAGLQGAESAAQGWDRDNADPRAEEGKWGYVPTKPGKKWKAFVGE